jgi:hypothetical protein
MIIAIAFRLILLHGPGGQEIEINPNEIVSLREPRGEAEGHVSKEVRCMVNTVDGKFSAVVETCATVRGMAKENGGK